ncbi:basic salivary proline-rich protein 2 isoform X2 [Folsomia candida]|uniref:Repetitive proline-rich cell wall protein 2 n=1 Tax=Folsomia candida TaxID=158441 RepID=A0A226F3V2_FOLCA|nr:basic salivary proline-rich protein 2 isoform X2 [Folsomia candida]OXA64104.1 Repetitive proline-rich cell wall protein 2 [Folsomia candida]
MRHIKRLAIVALWMGFMTIGVSEVRANYNRNNAVAGADEDEIMETSGQDILKDGQFANVLSGLLHQQPEEPVYNVQRLGDPDRILCLFKDSKSKRKKPESQTTQEGNHQHGNENQSQNSAEPNPPNFASHQVQNQNQNQGYGPPQQQNQAYGPPQEQNQVYGPPPQQTPAYGLPQQQNQAYGPPPQQNQAYGPPQEKNQGYGPPPQQNQAYGPPPQQNQAYGPPQEKNQGYGPPPQQNQAYGPPPQQNQAYGSPPQQNQAYGPPSRPPKSYSFSISFGDRLRPRKKQRHQQQFHGPPPPMAVGPVPPQQPVYFQPQQNFNVQPQQNFNSQPQLLTNSVQTNFQPSPPQTNFQPHQQTDHFASNIMSQPDSNPNTQYGVQPSPPQQYYNSPLDQVNYPLARPDQQINTGYNYDNQQEQKDLNFVYVYGPPENSFGDEASRPLPPVRVPHSKPETRYQVVVIKAPNPPPHPQVEIQLPTPPEQKTLVYVLVKKPQSAPEIKFTKPPTTTPAPPEVFFIKYKNNHQGLPSTSDINSDSYNAIAQNENDFASEQIAEKYVNNENEGGYREKFRPSFMLPSTSSAFAMEMGSNRPPLFSTSSSSSSSSHYTAPGSVPWNRK